VRHGEDVQMALPLEPPSAPPQLEPLDDWQRTIADYRSTGMTLDEHPMGLLRDELAPEILRSSDLEKTESGAIVEVAGSGGRPPAPGDRQGDRLHAARGRARRRQFDRPAPRLRALPRRGPRRPLVRAKGRLERHEGATNVVVSEVVELERSRNPRRQARKAPGAPKALPTGRRPARRRIRERAVAELRAVAPAGHSFGRRRVTTQANRGEIPWRMA
jgi:hypothetical protein